MTTHPKHDRPLTTAQRLYAEINGDAKYASIKWIANVLFTCCGKPASRLKALKALVDAGHEINTLSFVMPYQGIRVDGKAVATMALLDRGEQVAYSADWWKAT